MRKIKVNQNATDAATANLLGAALQLAQEGFRVFPCHYVRRDGTCSCGDDHLKPGKHPATRSGCKDATTDEAQILRWWDRPYNIGLATGHEWPGADGDHRYLAVIDIDVSEGKRGKESLAALIKQYGPLPETRHVRTGSGGTHYYFLTRVAVKNVKADEGSNNCPLGVHIDVRGKGGYVIAPPSNHESGEHYAWETKPDAAIAPMPERMEALLTGKANNAARTSAPGKVTSTVYRDSDAPDAAVAEQSYKAPTDEELQAALDAVPPEEINSYEPGAERPGCWWEVGAALWNILGNGEAAFQRWVEFSRRAPKYDTEYSKNVDKWESDLRRMWSNFRPSKYSYGTILHYAKLNKAYRIPHSGNETIVINAPDKVLAVTIRERLDSTCNLSPVLFRFGNKIARPERALRRGFKDEHEYQIQTLLKETALLQALNHQLDFVAVNKDGEHVPTNLPKRTAAYILECQPDQFPLPQIVGVTTAPVMLPDGTIHNSPGYSPVTRLYHYPQLEMDSVPEAPSKADVAEAVQLLLEVYCDIPFPHDSDRAHALALLMVPILRSLIDGDTPGHFITKPVQGTGATLLANAAIYLKTGCEKTYPQNAPTENAEWQKTILADLLTGVEFCFYDDCRSLLSPILATVLTSNGSYKGRKLGVNEMLLVPNRAIWMFLGNNPRLSKDLRRRLIDIRIDAQMADPTERTTFKHPNILPWLAEPGVRPAILKAIFTLARAWMRAGRPAAKTLASFGNWSHLIGGILEIAGIKGFLESPSDRLVDEQEAETTEFIYCLTAHRIKYPPGCGNGNPAFVRMKAAQILEMADHCGLEIAAGLKGQGQDRAKEFATNKLNPLKDRVFNVTATFQGGPSPGQLSGTEEWPSINVKLCYFPSGGDNHWKLLFESRNEKGERSWSPSIPGHFSRFEFADVYTGVDWTYRKKVA